MSPRRYGGFVLVMVLAMLVVLSLLAGSVAVVAQRLRDQALERERAMRDDIDMASTRATVLYLLTSQAVTIGGLTVDGQAADLARQNASPGDDAQVYILPIGNEIALDGSAYQGIGDIRFSLQDDAGLFGLNMQSPEAVARLLAQPPARASEAPQVLINRLEDYQDEDDLYRVGSMERAGYLAMGLRPPSNLPLSTPMEVLRVPGWAEALGNLPTGTLLDTVGSQFGGVTNVNTASERVLRTIEGVNADMARRAIDRRKLQPFLTSHEFLAFLGIPESVQTPVGVYPSTSGTLRMWPARGGQVRAMHWTMTPTEERGRPWREDYELIHSHDRPADEFARPVASRLLAKPAPAQD